MAQLQAAPWLSLRESQVPRVMHYTERCIEVRPLVPEGILSVCQTGSCPYAKFTCQSQNKQSPLPKKWSILYKTRGMLIECYSVN